MKLRAAPLFVAAFAALITLLSQAQQPADAPGAAPGKDKAKAKGGGTPKGINWPSPPLPDSFYKFDTGIERNLTLTITKGLNTPFSMVFPDANTILITERGGKLRIVRNGLLSPTPVPGLPPVQAAGLTGLMDMALHPNFAQNLLNYICYSKPAGDDGKAYGLTLARFRWNGTAISNWQDLYSTGVSGGGGGSRIVFGRDGMVYMNVSAGGDPPAPASMTAQDPGSLRGKVLRLRDDGTIPPDNPFVNRPDAKPEVFTTTLHAAARGRTRGAQLADGYSGKPTFFRRAFIRGSPRMRANSGKASCRPTRKGPAAALPSIATSARSLSPRPAKITA